MPTANIADWTGTEKALANYLVQKGLDWVREWISHDFDFLDEKAWSLNAAGLDAVGWVVIRHLTGAEPVEGLGDKAAVPGEHHRMEKDRVETAKMLADSLQFCEELRERLLKIERRLSIIVSKYARPA